MASSMSTILIIGGTSGIGEAFARRFHSMGKQIILTGRREQRLAAIKQSLPGLETYAFDMADLAAIPKHVETLFKQYPNIDTVWINGGISYMSDIKDLSSTTDEKAAAEVTTNVTAPILIGRHVIPRLLAQKRQTTFMITSSGQGFAPLSMFPVYCSTKAAIHSYMVAARQSLKDTNVNVIEIVPPYVGGTEINGDDADKLTHLTPMPLDEFVNTIFATLEGSDGKDLKEVSAGSGNDRVKAWRDGTGALLAKGLGG